MRPALLSAVAFFVGACTMAWAWDASGRQITDVGHYRDLGERIAHGEVPYRDFDVEYPPGALPVFVLPALVTGDRAGYTVVLGVVLALVGAVGVLITDRALVALGRDPTERRRLLVALALSPLLLGALLLARFDLVPAVLTTAALLALLRGSPRAAGLVLGAAIAVKLYPLVVLPAAAAWVVRRHGWHEARWLIALAVALPMVAYLPFALIAPDGTAWSIGHQLSRPLQIESLGASLLLVSHNVLGADLGWSSGHGSQNLTGSWAEALAPVSSVAQLAALAVVGWCIVRRPVTAERLVGLATAAVVAFVAFGKVISPQYLVWLLFLVPLLGGLRGRAAGLLYVAAAALTAWVFPTRYWQLVKEFDPLASWAVLARNLTLVALFVVLVLGLARQRDADGLDR